MTKETTKSILTWLFIFIVGSLIVTAIVNPGYRTSATNTIKDIFSTEGSYSSEDVIEDPLISSCLSDYNKYSDVFKQKYDHVRLKIITYQKTISEDEVIEFFSLYGNPLISQYTFMGLSPDWDNDYPVVMIATKIVASDGSIPLVLLCKPDGKLSDFSKMSIP